MTAQGERLTAADVWMTHCLRRYGYRLADIAALFGWSIHRTRKIARLIDRIDYRWKWSVEARQN